MKNYFHFNRSQAIGSLTLCGLIILCIVVHELLPYILVNPEQDKSELEQFKKEVELFEKKLQEQAALEKKEYQKKYEQRNYQYNSYRKYEEKKPKSYTKSNYTLSVFDPNIADSVDFINLGISSNIASNIMTYRAAGGKFRSVEQFSEIYGISEKKFEELKPYITILAEKKDTTEVKFKPKYSVKKDTILELNTADTTLLKLIKGIGSGYAKSIVYYRKSLGGFYHIEQLKEVPYLRTETYELIKNSFTIDTTLIKKIMVNTATVDYLKSHPYLNFYQAKEIYELRRWEFQLDNITQLYELEELDSADITRIKPYLSFEKRKERKRKK